jgi:hypothetical protein
MYFCWRRADTRHESALRPFLAVTIGAMASGAHLLENFLAGHGAGLCKHRDGRHANSMVMIVIEYFMHILETRE